MNPTLSHSRRFLLDPGWSFHKGDLPVDPRGKSWKTAAYRNEPGIGLAYDDSHWRTLDLPHDYLVEEPFDLTRGEPSRGYLTPQIAWYRRRFALPEALRGKRILLLFEGIFRNSTIYLNDFLVGSHPSGYLPVRFDLTPMLHCPGENVIAVRVDPTQPEGFWYEGAGIYRHAWLIITDNLHLPENGVFISTELDPTDLQAPTALHVTIEVANSRLTDACPRILSKVIDPAGDTACTLETSLELRSMREGIVELRGEIQAPALWSLDNPQRYRLVTSLFDGDTLCDQLSVPFGIRHATFHSEHGFLLNGQPLKIRGTCNHQDHAGVGWAAPDALQRFRIQRLKDFGFNACRTSHHVFSPAFLEACDALGMLVFAETRQCSANPEGLAALREMVRLERCRPSVILWGLGNEEEFLQNSPQARPVLETMRAVVRSLDPTRPVTLGMNTNHADPEGPIAVHDVIGFNYTWDQWDAIRAIHPDRCFIETEQANTYTTRGIYEDRSHEGYLTGYDKGNFWIKLTFTEDEVARQAARPWMAGGFIWTGFDYRGEPLPFMRLVWDQLHRTDPIPPVFSCHFGVFDLCGFPKDIAWFYRAQYRPEPLLHLFPHWNWPGREGEPLEIWCYSNAEEVELSLNGRPLERQPVPPFSHCVWQVPYEPGIIQAVGFRAGRETCRASRETTGQPVALRLNADRVRLSADAEDCLVLTVDAIDARGRHVPNAQVPVSFSIEGPARLIGVSNGDPVSTESDRATSRRLFSGLAMALVQALADPGHLVVRAHSPGLNTAEFRCKTIPTPRRPCVPSLIPPAAPCEGSSLKRPLAFPNDPFGFYRLNANTHPSLAVEPGGVH